MSDSHSTNHNPILAAWQQLASHHTPSTSSVECDDLRLESARTNPFLFQLLLKQWQRILKRLAYFYAQLASLPRRNRRALQRALATSLIGAAMLLALSSAPMVHAASITVSGACTLDEAITNANDDAATFPDCAAGSGADTIYLTGNVTIGVDTPAAALPNITSDITLEGNSFYVSGADTFRVFYVDNTGDFTINETTIQDGYTSGSGGGIFNKGILEITNSTLSGNDAAIRGGAIYNSLGTVTISNSTVSGNHADSPSGKGGGIYNGGRLELNNSTVSGNSAGRYGGGIFNYRVGALTTSNNSTLTGNVAGSGGGGIFNGFYGFVVLHRTLVIGNSGANNGNEILNGEFLTVSDYNLFGHSGETNAQAVVGILPGANDFNATSDGDGVSAHVPTALASILNTTLALNTNPNGTLTHALVTGSPALDKAPNADCSGKPINGVDQRGFARNVDIVPPPTANDCDIGAFELQLSTAVHVTNVRVVARQDRNILKWQTTSESQIAGFNVWRKKANGKWQMANSNFKQAKNAGSAQGNKYRFADKEVLHGKVYRYKIQVEYLDGHDEWTEVVRVKTP